MLSVVVPKSFPEFSDTENECTGSELAMVGVRAPDLEGAGEIPAKFLGQGNSRLQTVLGQRARWNSGLSFSL